MAIRSVSNQSQLDAAVRAALGGDTIVLASGTYAKLAMNGFNKGAKVTVTSADPGNPAVINSMLLKSSSSIEVKGVKLDYVPSKTGSTPFVIDSVRNVTINDVDLEGHIVSGYGSGLGLMVKGSQGVSLLNSEISNFQRGLKYENNSNVKISNNDLKGMKTDGMLLGSTRGGVIEGNDFRAMKSPSGDAHKDMIQFYTNSSQSPSSNIVIRNNVVDNPENSHTIFFGNELARSGNLSAFYRDILIENNNIRAAHTHGITMEHGDNVWIRGNTLVAAGSGKVPLINASKSSVDVTIKGNKVASVPGEQASWDVSGNITGSKTLWHWHGAGATLQPSSGGSLSASASKASAEAADFETGTDVDSGSDREDVDGVGERAAQDEGQVVVEEFDFSQGDTIVFKDFDPGTFAGARDGNRLKVWDAKSAVEVDSLADIQELVAASPDISATTDGDVLVLRIEQDGEVTEINLEGLGAEFRAEQHPDLF